jgi:hypothetical protein
MLTLILTPNNMNKLRTGVKVHQLENSKSYHNSNDEKVTRIDVYSAIYEFDTTYQDVTLDTAYEEWQENQLKELLQ